MRSTPRGSERQFRLMMPDLAVELLMPPLMAEITRRAPNVRIDVVPWRGPAIFAAEFARTIDLVITIGDAFTGFHRQLLYTHSDVLAVRRGHPAARRTEAQRHLSQCAPCRRRHPRPERRSDRSRLHPNGIERRIALVVPGQIEALHVTARTDLVAYVPRGPIGARQANR